MTYTTIISTDVLAAHLDRSWAVLDCRFDLQDEPWGHDQYLTSHIPGAVYVSLSHDLAAPKTGQAGRHPLPAPDALAATFGRLGIDRTTQVVAYDQGTWLFASRLWWMLRYMGHDQVAVLDGGWQKWTRESRPMRSGEETRAAVSFDGAPRARMRCELDEVAARLGDAHMLLVDARSPDRFAGRTEPIDRVAGHIPGAINHHHQLNLADDGTLLPAAVLRDRFTQLFGRRAPAETVMYCGSGVSACHNLLALEQAGLTGARLYPGSWSEWVSDEARSVETSGDATKPAGGDAHAPRSQASTSGADHGGMKRTDS